MQCKYREGKKIEKKERMNEWEFVEEEDVVLMGTKLWEKINVIDVLDL